MAAAFWVAGRYQLDGHRESLRESASADRALDRTRRKVSRGVSELIDGRAGSS